MTKHVTLKSFPGGIKIRLDDAVSFEQILKETEESFKDAAAFFKNSSVALQFQGRILTEEETDQLLDTIKSVCNLHIICLVCTDEDAKDYFTKLIDRTSRDVLEKEHYGQFYKGSLKDGEVFESGSGVILMGNVEKGAAIISKGSIIVLGTLSGTAYAGADGRKDRIIAALQLDAENLRIADIRYKKDRKEKTGFFNRKTAKLVTVSEEELIIGELDFTKELPDFSS